MILDHINIKAPKELIEKEKEFYQTILGLNVGTRAKFNNSGYWLYNDNSQAIIHLTTDENRGKSNNNQGYFDHFALKSQNLEGFIARLKHHNIDYQTRELKDIGVIQIFIYSPLGIRTEISFDTT